MAGYSGTPLPGKLGIKEGAVVALVDPPAGFAETTLAPLPMGVRLARAEEAPADVIVFFTHARSDLEARFGTLAGALKANGGLWVAWPKKASRVPTDLDENVIRELSLQAGLVDNKVCAIDETWSGLRFVFRLRDRASR